MTYCNFSDSPTYTAFRANAHYRPAPFPADPDRFGNGTKVIGGVVIEDSRPQPTVEMQSHCRGELPRVVSAKPLAIPQEGRDLIAALIAYWITVYHDDPGQSAQAKAAGRATARYEIWARQQSPNHDRWVKKQLEPMVKKNGKRPGKNGRDKATEQAKDTARQLTRLYKGEIEFKDGELVEVHKPRPVMTPIADLTPREIIRQAILRQLEQAPLSWASDRKYNLPYGFKMAHEGYADIVVYAILPKTKKNKWGGNSKSIQVGTLESDGWVALDNFHFEKALSKIMEIIKEHKLTDPNPNPPRPRNPASQKVYEEKAAA